MLRSDAAAIDQLFAAMSPQNRYRRFHAAVRTISAAMRRVLLDVDGLQRAAFVAEVAEGDEMRAIGIGRYAAIGADQVDVAVAVADDVPPARSRSGADGPYRLGRAGRRLPTLQAEVLPENTAAIRLMRAAFPAATMRRDGTGLRLVAGLPA